MIPLLLLVAAYYAAMCLAALVALTGLASAALPYQGKEGRLTDAGIGIIFTALALTMWLTRATITDIL